VFNQLFFPCLLHSFKEAQIPCEKTLLPVLALAVALWAMAQPLADACIRLSVIVTPWKSPSLRQPPPGTNSPAGQRAFPEPAARALTGYAIPQPYGEKTSRACQDHLYRLSVPDPLVVSVAQEVQAYGYYNRFPNEGESRQRRTLAPRGPIANRSAENASKPRPIKSFLRVEHSPFFKKGRKPPQRPYRRGSSFDIYLSFAPH